MNKLYRNKKNGNLYIYHGEVINCTNENDGQVMVSYGSMEKGEKFVREKNEFFEKFELCT